MKLYIKVLLSLACMFAYVSTTSSFSAVKTLKDFGIDKDVFDKCMKSAKIEDEARAVEMVNPASSPVQIEDMCFVECIYTNYPVGVTGEYKVKNDADKEWTISLKDEKTDPKKHNFVVEQCLEHATYKKDTAEKGFCEKGAATRMCHQQFSRLMSQVIEHLVKQEEFNP